MATSKAFVLPIVLTVIVLIFTSVSARELRAASTTRHLLQQGYGDPGTVPGYVYPTPTTPTYGYPTPPGGGYVNP